MVKSVSFQFGNVGTRHLLIPLGVDEPSLHTDQLSTRGKQHSEELTVLQKEPDIYPAGWKFTFIFTQLLEEIKSSPHDNRSLPHCGVKGHASLLESDSVILTLVPSSTSSMLKSASRQMWLPGLRNPHFELRRGAFRGKTGTLNLGYSSHGSVVFHL